VWEVEWWGLFKFCPLPRITELLLFVCGRVTDSVVLLGVEGWRGVNIAGGLGVSLDGLRLLCLGRDGYGCECVICFSFWTVAMLQSKIE
jgi:hypothetical protein